MAQLVKGALQGMQETRKANTDIVPPGWGWRAVVPASTANLGCAFDCGGIALKLYLKALFIPSDSDELILEYQGKTPERFPLDDSNLVLHALRFAAAELDVPPPAG